MRRISAALAVAVSSLALGGCQALFGGHSFASEAPSVDTASVDMADYFASRLEAGRIHLTQGRPAQAITAFRQASYDPRFAGAAYNGMGVAYAQIGRRDLTRRYFAMAVAADPLDQRFARNLARLDRPPAGGVNDLHLAADNPAAPQAPQRSYDASETQAPQAAALHRVSTREIQILSSAKPRSDRTIVSDPNASGGAARSIAVGTRAPATRYPVRVEPREAGPTHRTGYPVRIALADVKVTRGVTYPIRIELPKAD